MVRRRSWTPAAGGQAFLEQRFDAGEAFGDAHNVAGQVGLERG